MFFSSLYPIQIVIALFAMSKRPCFVSPFLKYLLHLLPMRSHFFGGKWPWETKVNIKVKKRLIWLEFSNVRGKEHFTWNATFHIRIGSGYTWGNMGKPLSHGLDVGLWFFIPIVPLTKKGKKLHLISKSIYSILYSFLMKIGGQPNMGHLKKYASQTSFPWPIKHAKIIFLETHFLRIHLLDYIS